MSRPRIAVTRTGLPGTGVERLAEIADMKIWPDNVGPDADQLPGFLADVDALLGMSQDVINGAVLDAAPDLVAIGQASAGYDNLDLDALTGRNVQASNCPGILMDTTADFAWTLILAASRRVVEADRAVRTGDWTSVKFDYLLGHDVGQRTLGIIGYGQIGRAVAQRGIGFGMRIIHVDLYAPSDDVSTRVELDELYEQADVISIHTTLNDETHHMIDTAALKKMKSTAVLVNAARGPIVDEAALVDALRTGEIFAAGLDVFEVEPIGPDHPLVALDNVVLAPHIASASLATRGGMVDIAAANLIEALAGKPMPNTLTPDVVPRTPSGDGVSS